MFKFTRVIEQKQKNSRPTWRKTEIEKEQGQGEFKRSAKINCWDLKQKSLIFEQLIFDCTEAIRLLNSHA